MTIIGLPKRTTSQVTLASRRPWSELFFPRSSYSILGSFQECCSRVHKNLNHFQVDDRVVLVSVVFLTDIAFALAGAWLNVLVSNIVGVGLIVLHAAFRTLEDRFLDEDEAVEGGLVSVGGGNNEPLSHEI